MCGWLNRIIFVSSLSTLSNILDLVMIGLATTSYCGVNYLVYLEGKLITFLFPKN